MILSKYDSDVERVLRQTKGYGMYRCVIGMLKAILNRMTAHMSIEQVCALQHNTRGVYLRLSHSMQPEMVNIDEEHLHQLTQCARGLLHDELNEPHTCTNCFACMDRAVWQNCELYHLLLKSPCRVEEQAHTDDTVCPYALIDERSMTL